MGEKDERLELSLRLGMGEEGMNQTSSLFLPSRMGKVMNSSSCFNDLFLSSDKNCDARSFLRGIDMNRVPSVTDCDEETGTSSPNSTISSISGKRSEREPIGDEPELAERASCSRGSDEEDGAGGDASRKKLRLSKEQSLVLEETFKEHSTLNPKQKMALAKQLCLRPRQVEVWFQNRRARTKLKQTEVDCEYLKRCCENLTEENRRLQKEVQELRALKLSPQLYMHMNPPTTLTMCPSCERVSVSSSSANNPTSSSTHAPASLTRHQIASNVHRPVPINNVFYRRPFETPSSRP